MSRRIDLMLPLIIFTGKFISFISRIFNLGSGGTWPGEMAIQFKPDILHDFFSQLKKGCILVAGTNGKTTTTLMIKKILVKEGLRVLHNESGANLLNGVVSTFVQNSSWTGKIDADFGVFEIDENTLPFVISFIKSEKFSLRSNDKKLIIVFLNLFRDQLDRYGEVDVIVEKWEKALATNGNSTMQIIANADDPLICEIARKASKNVTFFGLDDSSQFMKQMEHATDSIFCPRCGTRLEYKGIYYSHIGNWSCPKCKNKRPKLDMATWDYPLSGLYNRYNTLAAVSTVKALGITDEIIKKAFSDFSPAFGRQEEFVFNGKKIKIFLSKNPAGFNESLRTVISMGAKEILFVLNDRIPDGRDISWIWDVDFEMLPGYVMPVVSGDRAYDLALRLKYAKPVYKLPKGAISAPQTPILVYEDLKKALEFCLGSPNKDEILYILATYSAMLEVRKILKGRKIL